MPNTDLILVRHGVTDWNESGRLMGRSEIPINERGRAQARAVAAVLRAVPVRQLVSSPQQRAIETANEIAAMISTAIAVDDNLDEVWVGRWKGKSFDELRDEPDIQRYFADPTYVCDAVEPAEEVRKRVVAAAERWRAQEGPIVLVSHGDPLRILIAHSIGLPLRSFRSLTVSNGSISVLRFGSYGVRLLLLNNRPADGLVRLLDGSPP